MKTLTVKALLLFVLALTPFSSCLAADSAEGLVKALTQAIKDKDISAANALVDWRNAPVVAYRFFQMSIADCFDPPFCKVSTGPLEEADRSPQGGYVYAVQPEALLKVIPGDGNGDLTLPFAKVGSEYKIVMTQDTPETIARAKAEADPRKLAEQLDAELLTSGAALPSDGGEPAKAYRDYLAAVERGDSKYLAEKGTSSDRYFFGMGYANKPKKAEIAIELAKLENMKNPTIDAGYANDQKALLLLSGNAGNGWKAAGAVLLVKQDGKWTVEDRTVASYPG